MTQYGDFVQSATQILNLQPADTTESKQLKLQNQLMKVLSIQQHHDAITGTHSDNVAQDYKKMMNNSIRDALQSPISLNSEDDDQGLLATAIKKDAES